MKIAQHRFVDEEDVKLQAVLTADQYAKYQSQRAWLKQNGRPFRRPAKH